MIRGIVRPTVLVRVAALIVAPTPAAFACEAREEAGPVAPRPRYAGERERLLATCPAEAQGFVAWLQELAEREDRERPIVENDDYLFPTADAAQNLIYALSADQRAGVPIDSVRDRVIVQVRRGDNEVLAYLRENIEEPKRITTETVRWSRENLVATFADRLDTLPNASSWGYGLNSANGRIEVGVPGDAGEARRNSPRLSTRAPLESGTTYRPCDQTDVGMNSWAGTRNVSAAEAQTVP